MAANGGLVRLIIADGINSPINEFNSFKGYADASATAGTLITGARGDIADITVPAPGAMGLAGGLVLVGIRRRR